MALDFEKYKKEEFCLNKECVDYGKKDADNIEPDEIEMEDRGDRWSFVNVLPDSCFIHTVHNGPRKLQLLL